MTSKHTPLPWKQVIHKDKELWIEDENGSAICHFPSWLDDVGNPKQANADLVSAAPELLEVLKRVLRVADRNTNEFDAARAAIAKAQGQA